jgi:hypothetical protein
MPFVVGVDDVALVTDDDNTVAVTGDDGADSEHDGDIYDVVVDDDEEVDDDDDDDDDGVDDENAEVEGGSTRTTPVPNLAIFLADANCDASVHLSHWADSSAAVNGAIAPTHDEYRTSNKLSPAHTVIPKAYGHQK